MYGPIRVDIENIHVGESGHVMGKRQINRRNSLIVAPAVQKQAIGKGGVLAILGLAICVVLIAVFCLQLMQESLGGARERPSLVPLMLAVLGFFLCASTVAVVQGLRYSNRIVGPTQRLCTIMRKLQEGDLTVRAHLRRGDYLRDLASELNRLIDWLNENPPAGSTTGGDLVHFEDHADEQEEEAAEMPESELMVFGEDRTPDQ
ncbi:MAG: hypothetical protein ACYTG5_00490 [Planctomycetota bacterium]|jgi:methyl-accepting chemotaxis protein